MLVDWDRNKMRQSFIQDVLIMSNWESGELLSLGKNVD